MEWLSTLMSDMGNKESFSDGVKVSEEELNKMSEDTFKMTDAQKKETEGLELTKENEKAKKDKWSKLAGKMKGTTAAAEKKSKANGKAKARGFNSVADIGLNYDPAKYMLKG